MHHRNTPRFLYRTTFRMLSLHICLFHNNRRTQNLLLFQDLSEIRLFLQRYQNILSVRIISFLIFPTKKQSSFFQNLTVTLIYSFLHLLLAHYLLLRYEIVHTRDNSERSAVIKDAMHSADIIHMFDIFCCVGFDSLFGENWRKASTVLHLKISLSKRKKSS